MHGILRSSGQIWRNVLVVVGQQQVLKNANPLPAAGGIRWFAAAGQSGAPQIRNTSKVLSADKKGAGVNKERITLHGADGSLSITSLDEAQKLAKRRGLKLVKETDLDGKSQRPVYKLITIAKIKQEELDAAQGANTEKSKSSAASLKGDKMLNLNNKIAEHDLQSRLKHIDKWLAKQHKVIVVISGTVSDLSLSEGIFKRMEQIAEGKGRIVQKRTKGSEIRFQILPTPPTTTPADGGAP